MGTRKNKSKVAYKQLQQSAKKVKDKIEADELKEEAVDKKPVIVRSKLF
jgi:hypothetical protein